MAKFTISQLDQMPDDYSLVDTDLVLATIGTSTPFLSSVKLSLKQLDTSLTDFEAHWAKKLSDNTLSYTVANVGIGTTTPDKSLHVEGSSIGTAIRVKSTAANSWPGIRFQNDAQEWHIYCDGSQGDAYTIYDHTNTAYRLAITTSGNVGIGTVAPAKTLHIHEGSSGANELKITNNTTGVGSTDGFGVGIDTDEIAYIWNYESGGDLSLGAGNNNRMLIDGGTGNVGIGTTAPTQLLDVVNSTGSASIRVGTGTATDDANLILGAGGTSGDAIINCTSANRPIIFQFAGTERMRIEGGGNVGIGTAAPAETLTVAGTISARGGLGNTNQMVLSGGSLCIGLQSNGAPRLTGEDSLHVVGTTDHNYASFGDSGNNSCTANQATVILNGDATGNGVGPGLEFYAGSNGSRGLLNMTRDSSGEHSSFRFYCGHGSAQHQNGDETMIISGGTYTRSVAMQLWRYNAVDDNTNYFFNCIDNQSPANTGVHRFKLYADGDVWNHDGTYGGSDIRLKENVVDASNKLDDLLKLKVRNFNFRTHDSENGEEVHSVEAASKKRIGFIAQELEEVFPSMVLEDDWASHQAGPVYLEGDDIPEGLNVGDPREDHHPLVRKSIKHSALIPVLVKSIQELAAEVEDLKSKIS